MKKIILITLLGFITLSSFAQMGTDKMGAKQIEELKTRPLLVVDYGNYTGFEDKMKTAMEAVWTFSPSVKFISSKEWKTLYRDKDEAKKYAYLYYTLSPLQANAPANSFLIGLLDKKMSAHFAVSPDVREENAGTVADLMFALKNLQSDLEIGDQYKKIVKEQSKSFSKYLKDSLQHKTLYIDKEMASKKLLKTIDDIYEYPYKLVDKEVIDNAIVNKNSDVLFLREVFIAQRPRTRTKEFAGTETTKTSSIGYSFFYLYKASDLEIVGGTGFSKGKLEPKGIEMLLTLMNY